MAKLVWEVCQQNEKSTITGVAPQNGREELFAARRDLPAFCLAGLLNPPRIEVLDACLFRTDGRLDGMVHIGASGVYGVMNVYVILEDDRGNRIESGFALEDYLTEGYWCYFPSASLRPGMTVTVRAMAMDRLGGVGTQMEHVTVE
jgi:hypothetical protein